MLKLRRGVVTSAQPPGAGIQRMTVRVAVIDDAPGAERPAFADVGLVGESAVGDELIVNVEALDLALGSGGADVVHANLTRGLAGEGAPGAHVMKLNYTSLQHAVAPVEGERLSLPLRAPVAVISLHGQLAPFAWALQRAAPGTRVGYVQTPGGALPGALSDVAGELRRRGLLAAHVTAGASYGGEAEAISTVGALHDGIAERGWDVAVCGPGPGILGSGSALGHGGTVALDSAHAALALGAPTVVVPRMSSGDPRPRHRGLSHHTRTMLTLLLAPVTVPLPAGEAADRALAQAGAGEALARHETPPAEADIDGYRSSGLPARTMGRDIGDDELFFAAALAAGEVVGGIARAARAARR